MVDLQRMAYPHKWSPISYRSSAGQRKHAGQRPTLYRWTTQPVHIALACWPTQRSSFCKCKRKIQGAVNEGCQDTERQKFDVLKWNIKQFTISLMYTAHRTNQSCIQLLSQSQQCNVYNQLFTLSIVCETVRTCQMTVCSKSSYSLTVITRNVGQCPT